MSSVVRGISTFVAGLVVLSMCWIFVGFAARAVKELFCLGYGC